MNKWCFLLIAACLLAPDTGHAALKARDDVKAEDAFNPNPAPDDLILPMPCGQSMVLKAVGVRGKGLLWDLETRFGRRDGGSDDRGYYDSPYASAISGPFVLKDLPPDWRQKIKAANPDADPRVPVELVTTSASGLDNNLTPAAALWQVPRVAQARQLSVEQVTQLVNQATQTPLLSFLGQPVVNILQLNMALDALKDK